MALGEEIRRLPEWLEGSGPKVNLVLFALMLGVLLPLVMGLGYLDPVIITGVSCVSVVFVAAAGGPAAKGLGNESLAGRILALTAGGAVYGLLVVVLGVGVINLQRWYGAPIIPGTATWATLPLLPASLSVFLAIASVRMTRRGHRPREIGTRFRWTVLLLVLAWTARGLWMPGVMREAIESRITTAALALTVVVVSAALGIFAAVGYRKLRDTD